MEQSGRLSDWLGGTSWRLVDHSAEPLEGDVLLPFAVEELECDRVAAGALPVLHVWRHRKALVLGLRDRKLPSAREAMESFRAEGWSVMVRNSGGAVVPLDEGVLNATVIMPSKPGKMALHADFAMMANFVREAVGRTGAGLGAEIGEVAGAYCPGEFDLSAGGRKFCGIAQRRKLGAYAIQAFVVAEGSGRERAETAGRFYRLAGGASAGVRPVLPDSTKSLSEWSDQASVSRLAGAFRDSLRQHAGIAEIADGYDAYDVRELQAIMANMIARYDTD